jgi:hypothetical protein
VATAEQGPAGAWPGDRSSGRTEKVRWEQAGTREETRLLKTGDFTVANHYTKDVTTTYELRLKWAAGVSAYRRLTCLVPEGHIRMKVANKVVRVYIKGLASNKRPVTDLGGRGRHDRHDPAPAGWGPMIEAPNLEIEVEAVNPDMDENGGRSGIAYVAGRAGEPDMLDISKATGRHVSSMSRRRYQHLYSRYMSVTAAVGTELKDRGFVEEVVSLVRRYQGKSGVGTEKWFRNHWTVHEGIVNALREGLGLDTEVFASPLNVHMGTKAYCSAFDRDKLVGYVGSAWDYQWTRVGGISLEFNPEYEAPDLKKALKWALASAEATDEPCLALGVYPVWGKSPYTKVYEHTNPYIHELIRVPQTYFDFQTPDFWKGGGLGVRALPSHL